MSENIAGVISGRRNFSVQKWPMPEIEKGNEVLIRMSRVGICGSDVKLWSTGSLASNTIDKPFVMGHEGAGVVVKVGADVKNLKVGDRVAIEPTQPCRYCEYCKEGRYNLCVEPNYCSANDAPGNMSRYYKHVSDFCHKIPENLSMEEGAAMQPLAIAIHACNRAGVKMGQKLAILGSGPIGVLCAMVAKASGVSKVVMTDILESRVKSATEFGADYSLLVKQEDSDQQVVDRIINVLGTRPDVTIDACGYGSAQRIAMLVTKTGGTVLVVGIADTIVEVPLSQALLREVDIKGSQRLVRSYGTALEAMSNGIISLKKFITHHFDIHRTEEALALAESRESMKIIIHLDD